MSALHVIEPGFRSTIQDRGRFGHLRSAVPHAGPADPVAFEAAQWLAGNDRSTAAIEIVGLPLRATCDRPALVAVTGRDVALRTRSRIDGWTAAFVRAGEEFAVVGGERTRFAYLAVGGGIAVPEVLGSRSTYLTAGVGPVPRPLAAGEVLPLGEPRYGVERAGRSIAFQYETAIAALPGPHAERLRRDSALFGRGFRVSEESDRMGVRLEGDPVEIERGEILSVGIATGAVQIPSGGRPIVLLADHATTGGYPIVATVASFWLGSVAQAAPGDVIELYAVSADAATLPLRAWRARLGSF